MVAIWWLVTALTEVLKPVTKGNKLATLLSVFAIGIGLSFLYEASQGEIVNYYDTLLKWIQYWLEWAGIYSMAQAWKNAVTNFKPLD